MAGLKVKIGADASEFERAMGKVRGQISSFQSMVGGLAAGAAAVYGITRAFQGLGAVLAESSSKAADFEVLTAQFETLTGSSQMAAKMIAEFRLEAQKSPLSATDYASAGKTLMAFGLGAEETLGALRMLGDVSMGNAERFGSLALAFAQTTAAGRLMGQEVLQFVNAGFNPLQQISKRTGESMLELKKRMEAGGVSASEVAQAFRDATSQGGMFFNAIQKGAGTMQGKLAALNDTLDTLKIAFGTGMNEGLKSAVDVANREIPKLTEAFRTAGNTFGTAISEAVAGDATRLNAVGVAIGKLLVDGVKIGLTRGAFEIGENFFKATEAGNAMIFGEDIAKRLSKMAPVSSSKIGQAKDILTEDQAAAAVSSIVQSLRDIAVKEVINAQGGKFRTANEGEVSPFRDSQGRMVVLLESIDRKLNQKPFPN